MLDSTRDSIYELLLSDLQGYAYRRGGAVVGYGYLGKRTGRFALLDASDLPAALAHAETDAASRGDESFGVNVPMLNRVAIAYLLARNYRFGIGLDFISDEPFGKFERYLIGRPPLFILTKPRSAARPFHRGL